MRINRVRGDTQAQELILSTTVNGVKSLLDLDSVSKIEFSFNKSGIVIIKQCVKNVDPLTGKCYFLFTETDVDTVGGYQYDIQVTWLDLTKTTFIVDLFTLTDDVNKT